MQHTCKRGWLPGAGGELAERRSPDRPECRPSSNAEPQGMPQAWTLTSHRHSKIFAYPAGIEGN